VKASTRIQIDSVIVIVRTELDRNWKYDGIQYETSVDPNQHSLNVTTVDPNQHRLNVRTY
jgi:hypothetical protein